MADDSNAGTGSQALAPADEPGGEAIVPYRRPAAQPFNHDADAPIAPDAAHLAELLKGVAHWNGWRRAHPGIVPNLRGVDFADEAIFANSPLWANAGANQAQRRRPPRCVLNGIDLSDTDCRGSSFRHVEMMDADLRRASLIFCDFENADVWDAEIEGAKLSGANFKNADFGGVRYRRRQLRGTCLSIREAAGVVGDAVFRRDLLDQEYLDTLDMRIRRQLAARRWWAVFARDTVLTTSPLLGALVGLAATVTFAMLGHPLGPVTSVLCIVGLALVGIVLRAPIGQRLRFEAWAMFDYGRSWRRVALFGALSIVLFGFLFAQLEPTHLILTERMHPANVYSYMDPAQPFFLSAVSFASGGLVGVAKVKTNLGLAVLVLNALFGYATLGLFLAVLSNTFARQGN